MAFEVPPPEALPVVAASSPRTSSLISLGLLLVSVMFAIGGQLTLKSAMDQIGRIGTAEVSRPAETLKKAISEPRLWAGLALFGISSVFWLIVLSRVPLSLAYPVVGLSYIFVVAMARIMFNEHVPTLRWIGAVVVAIGIAIIGFSSKTVSGN